jgi:excinuclease UvrABC ATPase subunit
MKSTKRDEFVQTPILPDECPACHHVFEFTNRQVVRETDEKTLIHGNCQQCKGQLLVFQVGKDQSAMTAIALLTDLTYDDVRAYWAAEQVSQRDVLAMHSALKDSHAFLKDICTLNR